MKIAMFTNSYLPMVGGVATSIDRFAREMRRRRHEVLIVAPSYDDDGDAADDGPVVRVPSLHHLNGSDFSVAMPAGAGILRRIEQFKPDVIHSHHPFTVGNAAVRTAAVLGRPLVYTWHTMYEHYVHYIPVQAEMMKSFIVRMAVGYANLCDHVIAPSRSAADIIRDQGVAAPTTVIPTGVDVERFARGRGKAFRQAHDIPASACVVGHVGRLAEEKNLEFLTRAVAQAMRLQDDVYALIVGEGPLVPAMRQILHEAGVDGRAVFAGACRGATLVDAYHAMDCFAFASTTETQGLVLAEAMSAGKPAVALDAPGSREVVRDGLNGRLVQHPQVEAFAEAIRWICRRRGREATMLADAARTTAEAFSVKRCSQQLLELYARMVGSGNQPDPSTLTDWQKISQTLKSEWEIWWNRISALAEAVLE